MAPGTRAAARVMLLENILGTDMGKHGEIQNAIKGFGQLAPEERELSGKNKRILLKALVHAADIGNPTRPFEIAKSWADCIVGEFFRQGDVERALGLDISMLCDRTSTNFAKSQVGFINFMVAPYFEHISNLVPKLKIQVEYARLNGDKYKELIDECDLLMKKGNLDW